MPSDEPTGVPPDGRTGGPADGDAPRGADLARQILARAKEDARARNPGRNRSGRGQRGDPQPVPGAPGVPVRPKAPGIATPGRDWAEPVTFGAAVQRLLAERGWKAQATTSAVLARWDVLVGPEIASRCHPVGLRDGELVLAAESTAWATQLRLLSGRLLATLRDELGPDVVTKIVVRGPTGPTWNHGRLRTSDGRGPRDTYG